MMEKDSIDIIRKKEFIELNDSEKDAIADLCSTEDEFYAMKSMFVNMDSLVVDPITPKTETKTALDDLFHQTYPKATPIWYNSLFAIIVPKEKPIYRQPLAQIAAVLLVFWMVFPFFNDTLVKENKQVAKVEVKELKTKEQESIVEKELEVPATEKANENDVATIQQERNQTVESPNVPLTNARSFVASSAPVMYKDEINDAVLSEGDRSVFEVSSHPDGVFMGVSSRTVAYAQPASESQDLLDLLTPTF